MALVSRNLRTEKRTGDEVLVVFDPANPIDGLDIETADMRKRYERAPGIVFRTEGPRITYNCHGLTFASGRGWVDDDEVRGILQDDNYCRVERKDILPGDIIIYVSEQGNPEHSGRITSLTQTVPPVPMVVSKWGKGEEIIHPANNCEYDYSRVEFWRLSK